MPDSPEWQAWLEHHLRALPEDSDVQTIQNHLQWVFAQIPPSTAASREFQRLKFVDSDEVKRLVAQREQVPHGTPEFRRLSRKLYRQEMFPGSTI